MLSEVNLARRSKGYFLYLSVNQDHVCWPVTGFPVLAEPLTDWWLSVTVSGEFRNKMRCLCLAGDYQVW